MLFGVVFDGDDTLWSTEKLYDDARSRAREVVAESGADAAKWEERERRIVASQPTQIGSKHILIMHAESLAKLAHLDGLTIQPGESFYLDAHVFDLHEPALEYFRAALVQLADQGLGPGRGRAELERTEQFGAEILKLCVEVGGVLTGEHGVGVEKRDLMPAMFSEIDLNQQQRLKCAFDAKGLLNPGKVFPTLHRCAELGRMHVHAGRVAHPDIPRF